MFGGKKTYGVLFSTRWEKHLHITLINKNMQGRQGKEMCAIQVANKVRVLLNLLRRVLLCWPKPAQHLREMGIG